MKKVFPGIVHVIPMNVIIITLVFVIGLAINIRVLSPLFGYVGMAIGSVIEAFVILVVWNWKKIKKAWRESCAEVQAEYDSERIGQ